LLIIWEYLRHPKYIKTEKINWSLFIASIFLGYLFIFPFGLFSGMLLKLFSFSDSDFRLGTIKIILAGILIAPLLEEFLFRLVLVPTYKNFVLLSIISFICAILSILKLSHTLCFIFLVLFVTTFLALLNVRVFKKVQFLLLRNFKLYFYVDCIIFGFYHLTNYSPVNWKLMVLAPLILLPQIILGTFIGTIRMKYGFLYAVIFHAIYNVFPVLSMLITNRNA
jgi:uncharacterized protein